MDKVLITQLLIEKMKEKLFIERFSLFDCLLGINLGFLTSRRFAIQQEKLNSRRPILWNLEGLFI